MNPDQLLAHYEKVADAPDAIPRLRRFILDLAVRGKLVPQDASDEPATRLLKRIEAEKARLVETGAIRKPKAISELAPDDIPFPLPENWHWSQIAEVGVLSPRNEAPDSKLASFVPMPMIPAEYGAAHQREVRSWGEIKKGYTHFADGDVALAKITPCFENGKSTVFRDLENGIGAGTTELHVVRPLFVDPEYLLIYLKSPHFIERGTPRMTGTAGQKRVPTEYFANSPFPLPPVPEQRRIVARVDELMALCDRLAAAREKREATRDRLTAASLSRLNWPDPDTRTFRANAAHILEALAPLTTRPDQIGHLRQTILNLAVRGKLVEQDPADEPVSVAGRKQDVEPPFNAPQGWRWVQFSDVASFENGDRSKKYPKRAEYVPAGVPWINTGHIQPDGSLCQSTMHYITEEKFQSLGGGKIRPGDLLYCLRGATFGKTAFVEPFEEGAIASSLMIIRPGNQIARRYTYLYLTSPLGREQLRRFDNGTAQPNLSSASVKRYMIPLPPLAEQHRIVTRVDTLMAFCDQLQAALTAAGTARARLLEALLHEALEPVSEVLEAAE